MKEEWKPVVGAEPDYMVSNLGFITTIAGSGNKNKGKKPRLVRGSYREGNGSESFSMYGKGFNAAKTVAEAFIDNPNNYKHIYFKDGNKRNVRVDNLEWAEFTPAKEKRVRDEKAAEERLKKIRATMLKVDSEKEEPTTLASSPKGEWMNSPNRIIGKTLTNENYYVNPLQDLDYEYKTNKEI
jgi:hypothetical protein